MEVPVLFVIKNNGLFQMSHLTFETIRVHCFDRQTGHTHTLQDEGCAGLSR